MTEVLVRADQRQTGSRATCVLPAWTRLREAIVTDTRFPASPALSPTQEMPLPLFFTGVLVMGPPTAGLTTSTPRRATWTPGADELAARLTAPTQPAPATVMRLE
ncbi:hypothetical protein AB0E01_44440 [Nocardia vinacea]|uniref:hypothetical protein n=1 Tax=Nocardia vinacea TaxID=96468 RepID=UPI0033E2829B